MKKFFTLAAAAFLSVSAYAGLPTYDLVPQSWSPADGAEIDLTKQGAALNFSANLGAGIAPIEGAHGTLSCEEAGFSTNINISAMELGGDIYTLVKYDEEVTKSGIYVLNIPEGQWGDADFIAGNGGHANKAFTYTYTITCNEQGDTKTCEILSIEPGDKSVLAGFGPNSTITINTTDNTAVGYYEFTITDLNPLNPDEAVMRNAYGKHEFSSAPIVYTFGEFGLEFIEGHTYSFNVRLYGTPDYQGSSTPLAAEKTIEWTGSAEAYEYSPVKLVNTTPTPGEYDIENTPFFFTMIFDGWVELDLDKSIYYNGGMMDGTPIPAENVTYSEDHKEVHITVSDSYLRSCGSTAGISCFFRDQQGRYLYWGSDSKENSYIMIQYGNSIGLPELTIDPAAGEVTELSRFVVTCSANAGVLNYSYLPEKAQLVTPLGDRWELNAPVITRETGSGVNAKPVEWTFELDEPITDSGRYILMIPTGYFTSGEEFSAVNTKQATVEYTIAEKPANVVYDITAVEASVNPVADGYEIPIKWSVPSVSAAPDMTPTVTDAEGNVVAQSLDWVFDNMDFSIWGFKVPATAVEAGKEYTLNVPQGMIGDDTANSSNFKDGHLSVPVSIKFTTEAIVSVDNLEPAVVTYDFPAPESVEASVALGEFTVTLTYPEDAELNINDTMYEYPNVIGDVKVLDPQGVAVELTKLEARAINNVLTFTFAGISDVDTKEYTLVMGNGFIGNNEYAESNYTNGQANAEYKYGFTPLRLKYSDVTFDIIPTGYEVILDYIVNPSTVSFAWSMNVDLRFPESDRAVNLEPTGRYHTDCLGLGCKVLDAAGNEVSGVTVIASYDPWDYDIVRFSIFGLDKASTEKYTLYIPFNIIGNTDWWYASMTAGRAMPEYYAEFVPAEATPVQDTFAEGELVLMNGKENGVPTETNMLDGSTRIFCSYTYPVDVLFPGNFSDPNNINDTYIAVKNVATGEEVTTGDISITSPTSNVKQVDIDIPAEEFSNGGTFEVTIKQGLVGDATYIFFSDPKYSKGHVNAERKFEITLTGGVGNVAVDAEAANKDVYNLQGVLLIENATPEQVKALPAGLYIVGGEKIVIR